jgi:hypothetical protein
MRCSIEQGALFFRLFLYSAAYEDGKTFARWGEFLVNGGFALWAHSAKSPEHDSKETYFFNSFPQDLMDEHVHYQPLPPLPCRTVNRREA